MAAVTAITFVGHAHPNDGGIRPIDTIEFGEGDRPYFEFPAKRGESPRSRLVLIPTLENTVDDLLLLISYYLVEHPEIVSAVDNTYGEAIKGGYLEMYSNFTESQRYSLYEKVMPLQELPKVAICLFESSHLQRTVHHLENYSLTCEVCMSIFSRQYSRWTNRWESRGKLGG
ncbi:hypothetical protein [Candidatus Nitrotoga fabula]|uniref:Uncharacterized protein n=1 Tax=Candidatus Nitrotoga fabula TaxID=2182327 RepID=A0A916BDG8_9PROT|nr:hypothetical protein [Candidatus Nitrotoga fabula]CAE6723344.1 conserved hypothetical protein [Candidatus Nitrotoga fabula]